MKTYFALFLFTTFASLVLTPLVRRLCQRMAWFDSPVDDRRIHAHAIPRLGGVAIFATLAAALALLPFFNNLITAALREQRAELLAVLLPATLLFCFGVFDDLRGLNHRWKFLAQGLAGALFYALGGRIGGVTIPFVGSLELPAALGLACTVVWVVGISNAFNLIDGLDGLAAGAALFATVVLLIVSLMLGHPLVTVITVALAGALIGFLRYNLNPASIFLGDSGSLVIGFLLAALAVVGSQKASTVVAVVIPLLAFSVPILDTGVAIFRRYLSGKPLFAGDKEHVHHMLLARGWSQRRVAFVLYAVCALFGLLALLCVEDTSGRVTGLVLAIVATTVLFGVGRLRYHEVDEVRASVKRNLVERRIRGANNIAVRRASRAAAQAHNLAQLFAAMRQLLELGEFVYATVQLGRGGDGETSARLLAREQDDKGLRGAEVRGGLLCWEWERGDIEGAEIINSHLFWTLRLPLSTDHAGWGYITFYREFGGDGLLLDVNYLSNLFQRELARAVERIYTAAPAEGVISKVMRMSGEHLASFRS